MKNIRRKPLASSAFQLVSFCYSAKMPVATGFQTCGKTQELRENPSREYGIERGKILLSKTDTEFTSSASTEPTTGVPKTLQNVYPCVQEILICQDWFWKLSRWLIVYHLQSQMRKWKQRGKEWITHKLASAECWKVATNSDNLPSDLAPYHFTTFWWIAQKWNIHELRLWIWKNSGFFLSWNEVLHCSSCGQSWKKHSSCLSNKVVRADYS